MNRGAGENLRQVLCSFLFGELSLSLLISLPNAGFLVVIGPQSVFKCRRQVDGEVAGDRCEVFTFAGVNQGRGSNRVYVERRTERRVGFRELARQSSHICTERLGVCDSFFRQELLDRKFENRSCRCEAHSGGIRSKHLLVRDPTRGERVPDLCARFAHQKLLSRLSKLPYAVDSVIEPAFIPALNRTSKVERSGRIESEPRLEFLRERTEHSVDQRFKLETVDAGIDLSNERLQTGRDD